MARGPFTAYSRLVLSPRIALALSTLAFVVGVTGCADPEERSLVYDARFGEATSMNVYLPAGGGSERPAVLLVHGGGWRYFDKDNYTGLGRRLARAGYVAASVDYRLVPDGAFPRAAQDVGCALAYLQRHEDELGIDPGRIALFGYSAGGHLAALVAVATDDPGIAPDCADGVPARPAGVVAGAGPMDLVAMRGSGAVQDFLGGPYEGREDAYTLASPIAHVDPDDPPFLLLHGDADFFVSLSQSRAMRDRLREEGVEASLLELRGAAHLLNPSDDSSTFGIASATDLPEVWIAVIDFLERTVGVP
jgi:acetyl esterase/lipase